MSKEVGIQVESMPNEIPQKVMIENFVKVMIDLIRVKKPINLEEHCSKLIHKIFNLEIDLGKFEHTEPKNSENVDFNVVSQTSSKNPRKNSTSSQKGTRKDNKK